MATEKEKEQAGRGAGRRRDVAPRRDRPGDEDQPAGRGVFDRPAGCGGVPPPAPRAGPGGREDLGRRPRPDGRGGRQKYSLQIDAIMHAAEFKNLESSWRSMKYLVDKTDFRENVKIGAAQREQGEPPRGLRGLSEVVKSGLYKIAYTAEFGQFGGQPYGSVIGNYDFGPGPQDVKALQYVASVAAMSHAPFIASAGPGFFGLTDFSNLPNLKDLKSIFESPQYTKWRSFRETEDARYVALTMPRFLLRLPYGPDTAPVKKFNYQEDVSQSQWLYTWGTPPSRSPPASTTASRSTGGARTSSDRPAAGRSRIFLHQFQSMGATQTKIPTEVLVSERREFELAEEGFIALTMRKGATTRPSSPRIPSRSRSSSGSARPGRRRSQLQTRHAACRTCSSSTAWRTTSRCSRGRTSGRGRSARNCRRSQHLDRPVRVRDGEPLGIRPEPPPAANGRGHRGGRRRGSRAGTGSDSRSGRTSSSWGRSSRSRSSGNWTSSNRKIKEE